MGSRLEKKVLFYMDSLERKWYLIGIKTYYDPAYKEMAVLDELGVLLENTGYAGQYVWLIRVVPSGGLVAVADPTQWIEFYGREIGRELRALHEWLRRKWDEWEKSLALRFSDIKRSGFY
jgi:hypothetical protein